MGNLERISFNQLPVGNRSKKSLNQIPIEAVDELADELVVEYANPDFREWYCSLIYKFGISKVLEWRRRATDGDMPAKLFSKYASDACNFKNYKRVQE